VVSTRYEDSPLDLIALGKKHLLDAVGLAIASEKAETGPIVRRYLADLGVLNGSSTVLGTNLHAGL
jgi:2-methylcitrate dehydratase PrpD